MNGGTVGLPERRCETRPGMGARMLTVGNMYPPHHAGGYEVMWQAAVRHARSLGHEVRVLASVYRDGVDRREDDPDVHRTLRWYWDLDRYEFPRLNVAQRLAVERHNAAELRRHLREMRPDLVAWWSMGCMSLSLIEQARRAGVPAAFVVHDDWLVYGRQHDQWIRLWRGRRRMLAPAAERLFRIPTRVELTGAGRFVFNSRFTLERARAAGVDAPEMTVVHPGIDVRYLDSCPAAAWGWRLACVGRLDRQKGIDTAVRALAHLPSEATLDVWGTGDERYVAEMRALAFDLGLADRVRFRGGVGVTELRAAYADSDVVVFPVRWEEPFGLVPLEAMGIGRLVVSTLRGGTAEFVLDGENALVFDVDDDAGLARRLRMLADDPQLRARLREGGRQTAAQYTVERFAERTVEEMVRAARAPRSAAGTPR